MTSTRDALVQQAYRASKSWLADSLVRLGVVYPTPSELKRLPKDELVSMWLQYVQPKGN